MRSVIRDGTMHRSSCLVVSFHIRGLFGLCRPWSHQFAVCKPPEEEHANNVMLTVFRGRRDFFPSNYDSASGDGSATLKLSMRDANGAVIVPEQASASLAVSVLWRGWCDAYRVEVDRPSTRYQM